MSVPAKARSALPATSSASQNTQPSPGSAGHGLHLVQLKASLRGHDFATQVQMLAPDQRKASAAGTVQQVAARGMAGSGGKLPYAERIQRSFGAYDISNVQAHTDGHALDAAHAMGADAYASGNHVALGAGGRDLHTVAHEAAHVVQQRHGVALSGGVGQAGDPYERHADAVADLVVQGKSAEDLLGRMAGGAGGGRNIQMKPERPDNTTPGAGSTTTVKSRDITHTTREDSTHVTLDEHGAIQAELQTWSVELEQCATEQACAELLHDIARKIGCAPRIVRMLWQKTDAGMAWSRKARVRNRSVTTSRREESREVKVDDRVHEPLENEDACTMTEIDRYRDLSVGLAEDLRLELKFARLADHAGFSAAMNVIQNTMAFANEFDATPQFAQALGTALFGSIESNVQRGTKAMTAGAGKAIGDYIFKAVDALVDERQRALAARRDMKVRDFLNGAIFTEVAAMDGTLGKALGGVEFTLLLKAAIENGIATACQRGDDVADAATRVLAEIRAQTMGVLGFEGLTLASDRLQEALKSLITGLSAGGFIDHGNVSIEATRRGAQYALSEPEVEHRPPVLRVPARSGAIADAINEYIARFGGSINMVPIEKRIKVTVNFDDIGDPFFGYFMDGSGRWQAEGKAGDASIHPLHLARMKPHGELEQVHFDTWRQAKSLVGPKLERMKVKGDG